MVKNKKIMLVDFDDQFFIDIISNLIKKGVKILYLITCSEKDYKNNSLTKNIKLFNPEIFSYPKFINQLNIHNNETLSTGIINDFIEYENLFLTISDRLCFFPISVKERKMIYQELLLYWYSFFKKIHLDAVIFASTPHLGFYNIIYGVAKKLNVKNLYIIRTLIENRVLLLNDYKEITKIPPCFLQSKNKEELIKIIGNDFYEEIFKPSIWIKRSINLNQKVINRNLFFRLKEFIAVCFRFIKFIFQGSSTSVFYLNNGCNKIFIGLLCIYVNFKVNQLRNYYQKNVSMVNWNKKFVYFSLHFQPERSTVPEGGVFENQLLALDILSKSIPKDWLIYVKEHPRQFESNDPRRIHYRNKEFYDKMLRNKNVRLIKIDEDSGKLIQKAIFTVTITGSAGWQSLIKNKPCLVFGNPWYSGCQSCFIADSIDKCKETINFILQKNLKEVETDVLKYLAFYKDRFIKR